MNIRPAINVTPLIDVLLVLLIIFMVISPAKPSQIETKAPAEPKNLEPAKENPHTLLVEIRSDLSFRLNKEHEYSGIDELEQFREELAFVFEQRANENVRDENGKLIKTVFIKAPRSLTYGTVVRFVDAVKFAGANPVALQVEGLE